MSELMWMLVAVFETRTLQPGFHAFDSYVQQHDLPAKRFQADPDTRALVVPLGELCESSDEVQCVVESEQPIDPAETTVIVFSSSIKRPELDTVVSKVRQFDAAPETMVVLPDPLKMPGMKVDECCGSIALRAAAESHRYSLYPLAAAKPGLRMSPEGMRKVPEDKDYLKDRESWFQERYKKPK